MQTKVYKDSPRPRAEVSIKKPSIKYSYEPNLNLFTSDKYKGVKIDKRSILAHLQVYEKETLGARDAYGDCPELVIIKNIASRYENPDDTLTTKDVELLVNLIKLNRQERHNRVYELVHDTMFDSMINMYKLVPFLERRFLFSLHSFE